MTYIETVLLLSIIFFGLTTTVLFITVWSWRRNHNQLLKWNVISRKWEEVLSQAIHGAPTNLPAVSSSEEAYDLIRLWCEYQGSVRGDARTALNNLALRLGLDKYAIELVEKGDNAHKYVAITALGYLRNREAFGLLEANIGHKNPDLAFVCARALIQIDASLGLLLVLPLMSSRKEWPEMRLAALFNEAGDGVIENCLPKYLVENDVSDSARLVQFLRHLQPTKQFIAVTHLLERSTVDAIKVECLSLLRLPEEIRYALHFLSHGDSNYKRAAIQVISRLGTNKNIAALNPLAFDAHLGVRFDAIKAIAKLDNIQQTSLDELDMKASDVVTKQMLQEARVHKKVSV